MSPAIVNAVGDSSNELWAGKSRNAKAQARHRAKRKAYIEQVLISSLSSSMLWVLNQVFQLEQTVSKLQTALALSADDVANLPTTQAKLRELKEENDSLRAEIRKLQTQPSAPGYIVPPIQMHSPPLSDEYPRRSKRRKMSPPPAEEYSQRNTYLASVLSAIPRHHRLRASDPSSFVSALGSGRFPGRRLVCTSWQLLEFALIGAPRGYTHASTTCRVPIAASHHAHPTAFACRPARLAELKGNPLSVDVVLKSIIHQSSCRPILVTPQPSKVFIWFQLILRV